MRWARMFSKLEPSWKINPSTLVTSPQMLASCQAAVRFSSTTCSKTLLEGEFPTLLKESSIGRFGSLEEAHVCIQFPWEELHKTFAQWYLHKIVYEERSNFLKVTNSLLTTQALSELNVENRYRSYQSSWISYCQRRSWISEYPNCNGRKPDKMKKNQWRYLNTNQVEHPKSVWLLTCFLSLASSIQKEWLIKVRRLGLRQTNQSYSHFKSMKLPMMLHSVDQSF